MCHSQTNTRNPRTKEQYTMRKVIAALVLALAIPAIAAADVKRPSVIGKPVPLVELLIPEEIVPEKTRPPNGMTVRTIVPKDGSGPFVEGVTPPHYPVEGISVTMFDRNNNPVGTQKTNSNGETYWLHTETFTIMIEVGDQHQLKLVTDAPPGYELTFIMYRSPPPP